MDPTLVPVRVNQHSALPKVSPEEYNLIKSIIAPPGTPDTQIRLAMAYALQLGLDPLRRQVFVIKTGEGHQVVVGLHGVSAKVSTHPEYRGTQSAAVYPGEEISIHAGDGRVQHTFNPLKRAGAPVGAWSTTTRQIGSSLIPFTIYVRYEEYAKPASRSWKDQPAWMIEKTARMFSMRAAFPDVLSNIYAPEEFGERSGDTEGDQGGPLPSSDRPPTPVLPWQKPIEVNPIQEEYGRCGTCGSANVLHQYKSGVMKVQCPEGLRLYGATGDPSHLREHHSAPWKSDPSVGSQT